MKKQVGSLLILCMICLSSMFIIFQNSPFTPFISQNEVNNEENFPENDSISINDVKDYSKQGEDLHNPQNLADFSQLFYKYKNSTVYQANATIEYLISNLWDSNYKGFNDTDLINAKKRTFDNMLMIIELLEYHDGKYQLEYITYAEEIFNFEYNFLWDDQTKLFLSYCDYNGDNAVAQTNSSDNILAIVSLLKLFKATNNQTYLDIANLTYAAFNSVFYDATYGGYYRSNLSGDTNKFTYDNFLASLFLAEISRTGYLSSEIQDNALERAENTLELLIFYYLNDTYGFFSSGDRYWDNPNEDKSALINALAINTLIPLYEINLNQTYLNIAVDIAEFIDFAFWDSTGIYRGYNTIVSWDGSNTLNSTKFLEVNSLILKAFLRLFEKTYNSTYYQDAINISEFLNIYLWDSNTNAFNYSVDFDDAALNSSLKSTVANAWAIQALLNYRYPRPYLTRANTTMTMLNRYMYSNEAFDNLVMYDWSPLSSHIILDVPLITLEDIFEVTRTSSGNLKAIYTLLELSEKTQLNDYILLANETMYFLYQNMFSHAFIENYTIDLEESATSFSIGTNAWGILSLLKLYEGIGDPLFLEMVNETWYFLRDNLWDSNVYGYNTSTTDNLTKNLLSNSIMIWANLEIANSIYPIFDDIRNNASLFANQTINIINQNMWDSINFGYYTNASSDWIPITENEIVKRTYENSFMIQTLLKYNNFYPNNPNKILYEGRINNTIEFLLNFLWDWDVGGFYLGCNEDGSYQNTDKYTYGNNWAIITFLELYDNTGNYSYYLMAEEINNFVNNYLWDFEYGGYFHWCSKDGVPYIFGIYPTLYGEILLSFKFFENQISSVLALSKLSAIKNKMAFPLVVDIEIQPEIFDRGPINLEITLKLIDIEGVPINQANISISTNGLYQTVAGENFYGFANSISLENQYGTNNFSGSLDISPFLSNFHVSILAYNSSMAVTSFFISENRTFGIYLSRAFALLNSLNLLFLDASGGYLREGELNTIFTFDNWMAILASLEYFNGSGLNLLVNFSNSNLEQILASYILNTFNFLNDNLLYGSINETSLAFFSSVQKDTYEVNPNILCKDTALGIISLLKYYQITNNSIYLDMANSTWEYLNTTFWDTEYLGYISVNGTWGNLTKYTIDNVWAIMANLALYSTAQIVEPIRNSAMDMANLTLSRLIQNIWDNEYLGFYSSFNGATWVPFNTSISCKQAEVNILTIQMLLEFAKLVGGLEQENYINYANQTFLFMDNLLKDREFLGYFSSCNRNGTELNTNKTLNENSLMVLALIDLYRINNFNYTYYQLAEETLFLIEQYFKSSYITIYHKVASQFGAIAYDFTNYMPLESPSNFIFVRSLTKTDLERQNMDYPLVIDHITVESPQLGEIQDTVNITLNVYDSNGNPVEDATVIGVIYGKYDVFSFTQLANNIYYCIVNISNLAGPITINFLASKESYSAGVKEFSFSRTFPIYVQKSYETFIALLIQLWGDENIFFEDEENLQYEALSNFLAIDAFLDFAEIGGDILWFFDWFANRTFISYSELIAQNLKKVLNSSMIQVNSENVSGYVSETESNVAVNLTECNSNAQAVITFLNLYNRTGDLFYLELANKTWLYLNETFWDPVNIGYFSDNSTNSANKTIYDNCLAILANLAINETLGINPTIRNQAFLLAHATFVKINQSLWDNINGSYFSYCDNDWSNPDYKTTIANALMIQTLLNFYLQDQTKTDYLLMAKITAEILIKHFYDSEYGGFYKRLLQNFSLPIDCPPCMNKSLSHNAWAILALTELYSITGNTTFYYKAEDAMNFVNTYLANHLNEYLNIQMSDINGYWDESNRSGFVFEKTSGKYVGKLESSALIIQALLKLYTIANSTLPWLNATIQFLPSSNLPDGEYCNLTISIFNKNGLKIVADLNITMIGWERTGDGSQQVIIQQLEYEYDSDSQKYKVKNVNLSIAEDYFFSIYAKNTSYIVWWNVYYLHRTQTFLLLWGVGGDWIESESYWQYTIGEDTIIIEGLYTDLATYQGIPRATLNFTVQFPNATIWFSELVITNSTGWGRLIFGPIPNIADLYGPYNITVFASHANASISPITWYASTSNIITINIDYGLSIPHFFPLESFVAQGDKIKCNVTVKHRMLANLSVDILIYSEGVLLPTLFSTNLTTGYNYFMIDSEVDERTPVGLHYIYINISFENKVIRDTYFFVTILSAAVIRDFYTPTWIAEDDVRYAVIEIEHRKRYETSNISVKVDCPALKENPTFQILPELTQQEYYFALEVKDDIPYGVYSGEIIVQRVNYTLDFEGAPLTFQIEVKSSLEVVSIQVPSRMFQNQWSVSSIKIQNNKISPITIKIVGYGDGFRDYEGIFSVDPAELDTINTPIVYYKDPWDTGVREYTLEIYYLNSSSEYSLISSNTFQIEVGFSLNNILLGFVLPSVIIAFAISWFLLYREKKKRERKKLK